MSRIFSMAYLSANGLPPVAAVELAAKLGFQCISFRLLPAGPDDNPPPLLQDDSLLRETLSAMKQNGVEMADAEMIRLNENGDLDRFRPFLERCKMLGARHILVAGDDKNRSRITENYARLCELTWEYDMTADLEFMPWTAIRNIADARELVDAADHPAAAILFDSLHFDRCGSTLDEIAAIPRKQLNYIQICDGPKPYDDDNHAMMVLARTARLVPGEGQIDFLPMLKHLPDDIPVSIEIPNFAEVAATGVEPFMKRAIEKSKALCALSKQS